MDPAAGILAGLSNGVASVEYLVIVYEWSVDSRSGTIWVAAPGKTSGMVSNSVKGKVLVALSIGS